jgi:hypothetical protein
MRTIIEATAQPWRKGLTARLGGGFVRFGCQLGMSGFQGGPVRLQAGQGSHVRQAGATRLPSGRRLRLVRPFPWRPGNIGSGALDPVYSGLRGL